MTLLMALFTLAVLIPLVLIFVHIIKMGFSSISLDFFTQIPKPTGESGGRYGQRHGRLRPCSSPSHRCSASRSASSAPST